MKRLVFEVTIEVADDCSTNEAQGFLECALAMPGHASEPFQNFDFVDSSFVGTLKRGRDA